MLGFIFNRSKDKLTPVKDTEQERDTASLQLMRESILTRRAAGQLQEALAHGAWLELRGGRQ